MGTEERNAGIDLLRMIAMVLVVALHVLAQGGVMNVAMETSNFHYYSLKAIQAIGSCAVPIYAIISGYVGVGKKWKPSNLINLVFTALFYTIGFSIVFYLLKPNEIGVGGMFKAMIPDYWYLMCYFGLFLFMPLLNNVLVNMSKKGLFYVLLALFLFFSCTSPIFMVMGRDPFRLVEGSSVIWLMFLYLIGGYLKLYRNEENNKKIRKLLLFIICIVITVCSKVITNLMGYDEINLLFHYTSPTIILASIAIVLIFADFKIACNSKKTITFLSTFSFSVYLIHMQELVTFYCIEDKFLWVLDYNAIFSFLMVIGCAIAIFICCTVIDLLRFYVFKLLHIKELAIWMEKIGAKFAKWIVCKFCVQDK